MISQADELKPAVKRLANAVAASLGKKEQKDEIVGAFLDTAHGDVRPLIDLLDLCEHLEGASAKSVRDAATALTKFFGRDTFVLEHKASEDLDGLNGVGIFAPAITSDRELLKMELSKKSYRRLGLVSGAKNKWPRLVYDGLGRALQPLNEKVIEFVNNTGATSRDDRSGVTQLILSLERVFQKFGLAVKTSQEEVDKAIETLTSEAGPQDRFSRGSAVRLGAPYLRLAGNGTPYPRETVPVGTAADIPTPLTSSKGANKKKTKSKAKTEQAESREPSGPLDSAAVSLAALEDALASVEKTTRRVLTNGRLGLGDVDVDPDPKPGGGLGDVDVDPDPKPGGGLGDVDVDPDPKPGGGLGFLAQSNGVGRIPLPSGTGGAAELFRHAALSLEALEHSVANVENVVATVLTNPTNGWKVRDEPEFRRRVHAHVSQSFSELMEQAAASELTIRHVVAHPAQGLGPGRQPGLGSEVRRRLALASGLSRRTLRML